MSLGRQYLLQRRIRNPESVSRHLFRTGTQLLRNRALCDPGERVEERRREFAAAIWELVRRLGVVYRVAVHRVEDMIRAETSASPDSAALRQPRHEVV
jgi:glycerol-3-phosphate O-acyltransferase